MGNRLKILIQCKGMPGRYTVQLKMISKGLILLYMYDRGERHVTIRQSCMREEDTQRFRDC